MSKNAYYLAILVLVVVSAIIIGTSGESILVRYLGTLWTIFFAICLWRAAQKAK